MARRPAHAQAADLAGDLVGLECLPETDQASAGALGQPDQGMGKRATMLGIDVDRDQRGDRGGSRLGDAAHLAAELPVVACGSAEQQHELVVAVSDPTEVRLEPELRLLLAVRGVGGRLADGIEQALPDLVEQGAIEIALGVEVLVEHRFGDTCRLGDVVHRGAVIAGATEHVDGHIEDLLAASVSGKSGGAHELPKGNQFRSHVRHRRARQP